MKRGERGETDLVQRVLDFRALPRAAAFVTGRIPDFGGFPLPVFFGTISTRARTVCNAYSGDVNIPRSKILS